jgi:hypothetical protein
MITLVVQSHLLTFRFTAQPWFALVEQNHLLTFRPWQKHELVCYHNTNFKHYAHGTNFICLDSTKAPS